MDGFSCLNHQNNYHRGHCKRKSQLVLRMAHLMQKNQQQQPCQHCIGPNDHRQPATCLNPEPNKFGISTAKRRNQ